MDLVTNLLALVPEDRIGVAVYRHLPLPGLEPSFVHADESVQRELARVQPHVASHISRVKRNRS